MKRAVGRNEKFKSFKLESLKLESIAEVWKSQAKLKSSSWSWKARAEVGKWLTTVHDRPLWLKSLLTKDHPLSLWTVLFCSNDRPRSPFWTVHIEPDAHYFMVYHTLRLIMNLLRVRVIKGSDWILQLQQNFPTSKKNFLISLGSSQFRLALYNFGEIFQLQTFQLKTFEFLVFWNSVYLRRRHLWKKIPTVIYMYVYFFVHKWRSTIFSKINFWNLSGFLHTQITLHDIPDLWIFCPRFTDRHHKW